MVLAVAAGCATLQQIAPFEAPEFQVERVELTGLDLQGGSLSLVLDVANPNPYDLPTTSLGVSIDLEDTHFGDVEVSDAPTLAQRAHTTVMVPLSFTWGGVGAGARAIVTRGAVRYGVDTRIGVETPLGMRTVNAHLDGEAPVRDLLRRD